MPNRKPTVVHELSGAFKKNPQRRRTHEPVPRGGIGPAPDWFTDSQRQCWDDVVTACPDGVATSSDRLSLEVLAVLLDQFRREAGEMKAGLISRLDILLCRFGLAPADRSRVEVPKQFTDNPYARLDR